MPSGACCGSSTCAGSSLWSRASAWLASSVCRAGKRVGWRTSSRHALRPQANRCTALCPGVESRVWLAAPSSAKCPPPGSGAWTAKCFSSAKMARSTECVVSASSARWNICWRLAGVRCIRPSAVSSEGAPVAAFAVHMAAELEVSRSRCSASRPARVMTSSSEPVKPRARRAFSEGLGWGGSTAWPTPRPATKRIFSSPWRAASRGWLTSPPWTVDARLPGERPP